MLRRKRNPRLWSPTLAATGWGESTFAELSWDQSRGAATRWAVAGMLLGALIAVVAFATALASQAAGSNGTSACAAWHSNCAPATTAA